MRILVTGGNGQLGRDCARVLAPAHVVRAIDVEQVDITDPAQVEGAVGGFAPDVLVNCAAFTRVDACETERQQAWKVNVHGPENLAAAMDKHGGRLVHISTDYVFDGKRPVPEPYVEEDAPGPVSFYGRTKLESEMVVKRKARNLLIVRTAWLYSEGGHNFLRTMLALASKDPHRPVKVVNDQFGCPTWSYRLALQIRRLMEAGARGTYHAASEGHCTWYGLARYFLDKMQVAHALVPCTTRQYPTPATRPANSILENRRLKRQGLHCMVPWKEDVDRFVEKFKPTLLLLREQGGSPIRD